MKRALIAMSGGVDSSVAAALMIENGYECVGCTMKLFSNEEICISSNRSCCSLDDALDARDVAFSLGMRYYVYNFSNEFESKVIDKFIRVYQEGGTPNPCIDCNRYIKFDDLYKRASEIGCDTIVTGHYARTRVCDSHLSNCPGRWQLLRSANRAKDQTYVLYFLTQEQLAHTQFPLGEFSSKDEVRQIADRYGFANAYKPDSQDICFVRRGKYADFIEEKTGKQCPHGNFVDRSGNILGEHNGIIRYTTGQRKGLGISARVPLYVKAKDISKNEVLLSPESEIYSDTIIADDFNWLSVPAPEEGVSIKVTAKPRYRAREENAIARMIDGGKVEVRFQEPQRALTIGQAVVLYDGDIVVGGGTIIQTRASQ